MALSKAPANDARDPVVWLSSLKRIANDRGYKPGWINIQFKHLFRTFPTATQHQLADALDNEPLEEVLDYVTASAKKAGATRKQKAKDALEVSRRCSICGEQFAPWRQTQKQCSPSCWRQAGKPGTEPPMPDPGRLRRIVLEGRS